jgi:hypothetical protein
MTCQALGVQHLKEEKPVSEIFHVLAARKLKPASASTRKCYSLDSRNDQYQRRRCSRQDNAWSSVRKCIPGPNGMTDFCNSSLEADAPAQIAQYCIYNLCKHSQYHHKLKAEAVECEHRSFNSLNQEMPYLDSFVKETSRLSPGAIGKTTSRPHEGESWKGDLISYANV